MSFLQRVQQLPRLGLGVSTEYGAGDVAGALDPQALRDHNPRYGGLLEVGVELARGLAFLTMTAAHLGDVPACRAAHRDFLAALQPIPGGPPFELQQLRHQLEKAAL